MSYQGIDGCILITISRLGSVQIVQMLAYFELLICSYSAVHVHMYLRMLYDRACCSFHIRFIAANADSMFPNDAYVEKAKASFGPSDVPL